MGPPSQCLRLLRFTFQRSPCGVGSFALRCRGLAPFPRGSLGQTVVLLLLGIWGQLQSPVLQPCPCSPPSLCFSGDCGTGAAGHLLPSPPSPQPRGPAFPCRAVFAVGSHPLRVLSGDVGSTSCSSTRAWASPGSCDADVSPPGKATFGFCCCSCFCQTLLWGQCCLQP